MMAGIHGSETKPERIIRKALFGRGFRYRKNCPDLPGKPDIKLTKYNAVIFIHGCFWHGHDCRYYKAPGSNSEFWSNKIERNRGRDAHDIAALRDLGWRVCVVWECVTRSPAFKSSSATIIDMLSEWITGGDPFLELYDPDAVQSSLEIAGQGMGTPGMNTDADRFVAERSASYEARIRD